LRAPGFTIPATAILALGFAAILSVSEVADAVFFRPLPFAAPDRLVTAWDGRWCPARSAPRSSPKRSGTPGSVPIPL
jgi:hypothetical protein